MTEGDFRRADLVRDPVQHAAPKPRAQRTGRLDGVENVVDELADARVLDAVVPSMRLAGPGDEVVFVFLVAGDDVDGDERKANRRALPQHIEHLKERPTVLAARQPDHYAIAVVDHLVVDDRLGCFLREARLELAAISHTLIVVAPKSKPGQSRLAIFSTRRIIAAPAALTDEPLSHGRG